MTTSEYEPLIIPIKKYFLLRDDLPYPRQHLRKVGELVLRS